MESTATAAARTLRRRPTPIRTPPGGSRNRRPRWSSAEDSTFSFGDVVHRHCRRSRAAAPALDGATSPDSALQGRLTRLHGSCRRPKSTSRSSPGGARRVVYLGPVAPTGRSTATSATARFDRLVPRPGMARLQLVPPARSAVPAQPRAGRRPRRRAGEPLCSTGTSASPTTRTTSSESRNRTRRATTISVSTSAVPRCSAGGEPTAGAGSTVKLPRPPAGPRPWSQEIAAADRRAGRSGASRGRHPGGGRPRSGHGEQRAQHGRLVRTRCP